MNAQQISIEPVVLPEESIMAADLFMRGMDLIRVARIALSSFVDCETDIDAIQCTIGFAIDRCFEPFDDAMNGRKQPIASEPAEG